VGKELQSSHERPIKVTGPGKLPAKGALEAPEDHAAGGSVEAHPILPRCRSQKLGKPVRFAVLPDEYPTADTSEPETAYPAAAQPGNDRSVSSHSGALDGPDQLWALSDLPENAEVRPL
jgi:hypothetical protein